MYTYIGLFLSFLIGKYVHECVDYLLIHCLKLSASFYLCNTYYIHSLYVYTQNTLLGL